ncbi:MAG: lysophospholipid acyltransferase family protein [Ramlibacter sp.]
MRNRSSTSFVESKTRGAPGERVRLNDRRAALHETLRLYLGFLLLAVICLAISLLALPMRIVLPRAARRRLGRGLIAASARTYLRLLVLMGAARFDLADLDALRDAPPMVIAPNHPSLLDAVMILSALPGATCIMKADIVNSLFFGAAARVAGYIRNTPLRTMVQSAIADLRQGSHVLLFPEGTRTVRFPVGSLQGTTGLVAKHAGVPVQTVFIETDSGFLGKGWSLLWTPRMPITYRVRLGKRFDPPSHTANFVGELEQYFQLELAHAQLPDFPVSRPVA